MGPINFLMVNPYIFQNDCEVFTQLRTISSITLLYFTSYNIIKLAYLISTSFSTDKRNIKTNTSHYTL